MRIGLFLIEFVTATWADQMAGITLHARALTCGGALPGI